MYMLSIINSTEEPFVEFVAGYFKYCGKRIICSLIANTPFPTLFSIQTKNGTFLLPGYLSFLSDSILMLVYEGKG